MISLHRVIAVTLRYFYSIWRNMGQLFDLMYWPLMDLLVFGYISVWMNLKSGNADPAVVLKMLSCLVLWQVVWRGNLEIALAILEDIWSRNLINLFSSPVLLSEWILGVMILSLVKTIFVACYGAAICWLVYGVNVFGIGPIFLVYMALAIMAGWVVGFIAGSMIILWGEKLQSMAWVIGWVFVPLSAVFYPLEVLPHWMRAIAYCLPMTHIFEDLRRFIGSGVVQIQPLMISGGLSVAYVAFMIIVFWRMFEKSRIKGLERLYS